MVSEADSGNGEMSDAEIAAATHKPGEMPAIEQVRSDESPEALAGKISDRVVDVSVESSRHGGSTVVTQSDGRGGERNVIVF